MTNRQYVAIAVSMLALAIAVGPVDLIGAQQQAPVRVPRAVLERYVGDYDQDGNTIKILLQGDTLIREVPGQRVILEPISETLFRMGPVFTAEFVMDHAGGVTLVFSDGIDIEYRLPRKGSRAAPPPAQPARPCGLRGRCSSATWAHTNTSRGRWAAPISESWSASRETH